MNQTRYIYRISFVLSWLQIFITGTFLEHMHDMESVNTYFVSQPFALVTVSNR